MTTEYFLEIVAHNHELTVAEVRDEITSAIDEIWKTNPKIQELFNHKPTLEEFFMEILGRAR